RERRVVNVNVANETRLIAAEDAAKYRDALGSVMPQGLPDAFLIGEARPLAALARRYARTHGPFTVSDLARRLGGGPALVQGALVWVGAGALGTRDGRVALYLAEHASLIPIPTPREGTTHERIREVLRQRGAIFFPQLRAALGGGFAPEIKDALWDLVWSGEV